MSKIYDQHEAAFSRVSAFVITHKGDRVAAIAFKYPADGAGRLYAYVHWIGSEMVRGYANGGGYDKKSAACADAARKPILVTVVDQDHNVKRVPATVFGKQDAFWKALRIDGGHSWEAELRNAGFTVLQAV